MKGSKRSALYNLAKSRLWTYVRENNEGGLGARPKIYVVCAIACRLRKVEGMTPRFGETRRHYVIRAAKACGLMNIPWRVVPNPDDRPPSEAAIAEFYLSKEWLGSKGRYGALKAGNGRCQACGTSRMQGVRLVVDHIAPIRTSWSRRFDDDNLQVLCDDCNLGKGSWDCTDWRTKGL